jgi:hypothetical protein
MKVGRVTLLRSAPGRSCDMMCMSTTSTNNGQKVVLNFQAGKNRRTIALLRVDDSLILSGIVSGIVGRRAVA